MDNAKKTETDKNVLWWIIGIAATFLFCIAVVLTSKLFSTSGGTDNGALPTISPAPTPVGVVVLDAGHGGFDGGATGINTGIAEAAINLAVTKMVENELKACNFEVILTREDDNALGDDKKSDMAKRKEIIQTDGVDLMISIHMNKFRDRSVHGPMVFYTEGSEESRKFAEVMISSVCEAVDHPKRMSNPGDYFVIRESNAPAVLVECGFMSNAADEKKLLDESYQKLLAEGIARGIIEYFRTICPE